MKILVIPDVHGSHNWETANQLINHVDKVIFIGDYVDSWDNKWPDQGENLFKIFQFARKYPGKVDILWGNHDWSYVSESRYGYQVSGHQIDKTTQIRALFESNMDLMKAVVSYDGWVFSHAGLTKTWIEIFKNHCEDRGVEFPSDDLFENINWAINNHKNDEIFDWYGMFSGSGDEVTQGPLWVRPGSLLSNAAYPMQVVGHTEVVEGVDFFAQKDDNRVIVVDDPTHSYLRILDTENEYEFFSLLDLAKKSKKRQKEINDEKARKGSE